MKKLRKHLSVMRLEERVLFDAAAVAAAAEAAQQEQENQDLQQQQQELQEQLAEEAAQQQAQQAQQAAGVDSQTPGADNDADADSEAPAADDAAAAQGGEAAQGDSAGSQVADAVESITGADGVEGSELADVSGGESGADVVGDTLEGLNQDQTDAQEPEAAAPAADADAEDTDADAAETAAAYAPDAEETPEPSEHHELAIISGTVPDSKVIIDSLAEGTEVLVIEGGDDALDQINEYLDASAVKYDAIHIISHGGNGFLVLNGQRIDMASLEADPASWAAIGEHLTADGDILLYGCNVAAGEDGKAFASQLASLTGADVAASVTPTGHYGWELEYTTGDVDAVAFAIDGYAVDLKAYVVVGDKGESDYKDGDSVKYKLNDAGQLVKSDLKEGKWVVDTTFNTAGTLQWCLTRSDVTEITSGTKDYGKVTLTFSSEFDDDPTSKTYLQKTAQISVKSSGISLDAGDDNIEFVDSPNISFDGGEFDIKTTGFVSGDLGNVTATYKKAAFTVSDVSQFQTRHYDSLQISGKGTFTLNDTRWAEIGYFSMGGGGTFDADSSVTVLSIGGQDVKKDSIDSAETFEYRASKVVWTETDDPGITPDAQNTVRRYSDLKTKNGEPRDTYIYVSGTKTWYVSSYDTANGGGRLWSGSYNILVLSGSGDANDEAYSYHVGNTVAQGAISAQQVNDDGIVYTDGAGGKSHINLSINQPIQDAEFGQSWTDAKNGEVISQGLNVTYQDDNRQVAVNKGNYHNLTLFGAGLSNPGYTRNIDSDVCVLGTLTLDESVRFFNVTDTLLTYKVADTVNTVWNVTGNWNFRRAYSGTDADQNVDIKSLGLITGGTANGFYDTTDPDYDPETGVPGFTVKGAVLNSGTMHFKQLGYRFMNVENSGTISTYERLTDYEDPLTGAAVRYLSFAHLDNKSGGTLDFTKPVRLEEMLVKNGGWTNYGTLNVEGYNYFGFDADTPLKITNYTGATMFFANLEVVRPSFTDYVFDSRPDGERADGVQQVFLVNGGTIAAGAGGRVVFVAFEELSGAQARAVYNVQGTEDYMHLAGAMYFELAHTIDAGIYGDIQVNGGTVNFNTEGQQYHGSVTIDGVAPKTGRSAEVGTANINQRSVFNGTFSSNEYSVVNVGTEGTHDGNTSDGADTNEFRFDNAVINRYYFADDARSLIAWHNNNLRTLENSDWQDFNLGIVYIGDIFAPWQGVLPDPRGAQVNDADGTAFNGKVTTKGTFTVNADDVTFEEALSVTHDFLIAGNNTEFKGVVTLSKGTLRNTVLSYADEDITGTVFKDDVKINGAESGYTALLSISALTEFQGSLTNTNGGVVVSHDGNVFHKITNTGSSAEFHMNSAGNYLEHEVTNEDGATFTLNNVNTFSKFTNDARLIVNREASTASERSSFITLENKSSGTAVFRGSFDIESEYVNEGTTLQQWGDIDYKGGIDNKSRGEFLLTNTGTGDDFYDGRYVFNGAVTNAGTFKVSSALAEFRKAVTNAATGTFLVSSQLDARYTNIPDGRANIFGEITNKGTFTVSAAASFEGSVTNSGTFNLNVGDLTFSKVVNTGSFNLYDAPQVIIRDLTLGKVTTKTTPGETADDEPTVTYDVTPGSVYVDEGSALHLYTVTTDEHDDESTITVRGRDRDGVYADHKTPGKDDSGHGLYFESKGTIYAQVLYETPSIEDAVWFNEGRTAIVSEEAQWIVINSSIVLNSAGSSALKYKVVSGGTVVVRNAAGGTQFKVAGGSLVFDNDTRELTINGTVDIRSGSMILSSGKGIVFDREVRNAGDVTIEAGNVANFVRGFVNTGTVKANAGFVGDVDNAGDFTLAAADAVISGDLDNSGKFTLAAVGAGVGGNINNSGNFVLAAAGTTLDGTFTNASGGTLTVAADGAVSGINDAAGSTIDVRSGATLTIDQAVVTADFVNSGKAVFASGIDFAGNVTGRGGSFTGANGNELLEFSGTTSGSGTFTGLSVVRYTGVNETNVLTGVYGNLELADAMKVVDNGVVRVDGTFANGNGVRITPTGELKLNGAVAGGGAIVNAGVVDINDDVAIYSAVDNSGTLNVNGTVTLSNVTNSAGGKIGLAGSNSTVIINDNAGTVDLTGGSVTAYVTGTNSGVFTVAGDNAGVTVTNNAGAIDVTGNNAVVTTSNDGSVSVSGSAALFGHNTGVITVAAGGSASTTMTDSPGAAFNVESGAALTLGNNSGTYYADFDNDGTITVDFPEAFLGTVAGTEGSRIVVSVNAAGTDIGYFLTPANKGALILEGKVDLTGRSIANNVQVNYALTDADLAGTAIVAGGTLGINADSTLNNKLNNTGTVQVGAGAVLTYGVPAWVPIDGRYVVDGTMQMTNDAEFSGDVIVHGSVIGSGDLAFSGSLNNDGTVSSLGGEAIFTGATSGSGSVVGSASYSGAATHVYGGAYDSLTVGSAAVLGGDAQVWNMNLNGSLGTANGSTLTIYGTANGNGTMTGGDGTVVYNGIAAMQRMYAGRYDNLVIGNSAVGKFNARGDIFISGDAVNRSAKAGIAVTNAAVTYDGAEAQRVMAGSYAALVLDGTGTKLMEPGVFKAGSFTAAGSPRSELTVTSDSGSERWILDARDVSIHYVDLRNADATRTIYLDGTNVTGGNISPRWEVFDSAGGIGDMFPSLANRNFRAIAFYADRLALDPAADPFAFAHRLPGSPLPIAVGESARTEPLVGAYDSYDLINFNGGDAGIRLLDEESREVLSDASAAGSSDLVELLEAK